MTAAMKSAPQAAQPRELSLVDDQFNPLIPVMELPFIRTHKFRGRRYFQSHWCVEVPDDLHDAEQLGREMALAFLRVAPRSGDRQSGMEWLARFVLEAQAKALQQGGNAAQVVYGFWGTVTRFAEPVATLNNVERWRGYTRELCEQAKIGDAACEAIVQRERSERGRRAAKARWARRRDGKGSARA